MTQAEDRTEEHKGRSGRSQLVVILLVAGLSMAGAYLVFFLASGGGVWGTTNNGEFVTPAMTMDALEPARRGRGTRGGGRALVVVDGGAWRVR